MTSGWQNSDLIIIAARPAMGKTAFVLSMAKNIAVDFRNPVALFSLEMSNVQLVNRLISNVCEIESGKIKSGQLAGHEWQQLDYKLKNLLDAPLYVDDTPSLSVFELRTKARRLVREHGVKIIIIDYLQADEREWYGIRQPSGRGEYDFSFVERIGERVEYSDRRTVTVESWSGEP